MSKFPRIINVGGLDIKGKQQAAAPNSTIEVTCTATTFVLLDPIYGAGQEDGRRGKEDRMKPHIQFLMAACIACSTGAVAARELRRLRLPPHRCAGRRSASSPGAHAGARLRLRPAVNGAIRSSAWCIPGPKRKRRRPRRCNGPPAIAGMLVDEVAVRGIVQTRGSFVAA